MKHPIFLFILLINFSFLNLLNAQPFAEINWQFFPNFEDVGIANLIHYDFDEDGIEELIFSSSAAAGSTFKILDYENSEYKEAYVSKLFEEEIRWMEIFDADGDGQYHLYISKSNETIEVYDLHTLEIIEEITLNIPASFTFGKFQMLPNSSGDSFEILTAALGTLYKLDNQGQVIGELSNAQFRNFAVGEVDNDGEMEIVLSLNSSGLVLNAVDFAIEWEIPNTLGYLLHLAETDTPGKALIFGAEYYSGAVVAYDAELQTFLWEFVGEEEITSISVIDYNEDGEFEVLLGYNNFEQSISCYDFATQAFLWNAATPDSHIANFSCADFDNDGLKEVAYGCGYNTTGLEYLVMLNPLLQSNDWIGDRYSQYTNFYLFDYNNDNVKDIVAFAAENEPGIYIFDGITKTKLAGPFDANTINDVVSVSTATFNDIPHLFILSENNLKSFNLETGLQVSSNNFFNIDAEDFYIKETASNNLEIFLFTDNGAIRSYDFNGDSFDFVWTTPTLNEPVAEFKVGNWDGDPAEEIAILVDGILYAYDSETEILEEQYSFGNNSKPSFEIADLNGDGDYQILFTADDYQFNTRNYLTGAFTTLPISGGFLSRITAKDLNDDGLAEVIFTNNNRLYIYELDGNQLFESPVINAGNIFSKIVAEDYDNDFF